MHTPMVATTLSFSSMAVFSFYTDKLAKILTVNGDLKFQCFDLKASRNCVRGLVVESSNDT